MRAAPAAARRHADRPVLPHRGLPQARAGYKNFQLAKFWRTEINIGRIELIRYNLESGERDLSIGDIGIRVCDLKLGLS